jgi:hypothetical protein
VQRRDAIHRLVPILVVALNLKGIAMLLHNARCLELCQCHPILALEHAVGQLAGSQAATGLVFQHPVQGGTHVSAGLQPLDNLHGLGSDCHTHRDPP